MLALGPWPGQEPLRTCSSSLQLRPFRFRLNHVFLPADYQPSQPASSSSQDPAAASDLLPKLADFPWRRRRGRGVLVVGLDLEVHKHPPLPRKGKKEEGKRAARTKRISNIHEETSRAVRQLMLTKLRACGQGASPPKLNCKETCKSQCFPCPCRTRARRAIPSWRCQKQRKSTVVETPLDQKMWKSRHHHESSDASHSIFVTEKWSSAGEKPSPTNCAEQAVCWSWSYFQTRAKEPAFEQWNAHGVPDACASCCAMLVCLAAWAPPVLWDQGSACCLCVCWSSPGCFQDHSSPTMWNVKSLVVRRSLCSCCSTTGSRLKSSGRVENMVSLSAVEQDYWVFTSIIFFSSHIPTRPLRLMFANWWSQPWYLAPYLLSASSLASGSSEVKRLAKKQGN